MNRNVTAIYRTHAVADLVRRELANVGVSRSSIHVVPDTDVAVAPNGRRDDDRYLDDLHDMNLPDNDLRTYQHCVRDGDYVVSVEVDDDLVTRVQEIMKRPETEARDFAARDEEFFNEPVVPHSNAPAGRDPASVWQPDTTSASGMRSYRRDRPAGGI
ncbi:hypothetical protein [Aquibium sp. ELW1220]|uniref:hypothetical protein n=1 Tax=Aquibium sp. ELW1220 TaxID=2976766 RepID=UPI0025B0C87A|nr:hypothetical protein [Aquibium sp. ELW1220]MDN2583887.1 hypothetical protein [Aquibium sp. ELW1220]